MKYEDHCERSEQMLGHKSPLIPVVNRWIDAYFQDQYFFHRKERHHIYGIEAARLLFGDDGARIAQQHILDDNNGKIPDIKEYYWHKGLVIPRDNFVRILYYSRNDSIYEDVGYDAKLSSWLRILRFALRKDDTPLVRYAILEYLKLDAEQK